MATRVVLDTNVLVASSWQRSSASRRLVEACRRGSLTPVLSAAVRREYGLMLGRAIRSKAGRTAAEEIIARAEMFEPGTVGRVVADREDDKLVALALAGRADVIVTNDRALLALGTYRGVRIVRPGDCLRVGLGSEGFIDGAGI